MNNNDILDADINKSEHKNPNYQLISVNKFAVLSFFTFGIYSTWWMFTCWKFFKEKDNMDIYPALRAIFSIFFFYSLLDRIKLNATTEDYKNSYSSGFLFACYLVLSLLGRLPDPFWLISLLSIIPVLPAYNLFNKTLLKSNKYDAVVRSGLSGGQWAVLIVGVLFTILVLAGLLLPEEDTYY